MLDGAVLLDHRNQTTVGTYFNFPHSLIAASQARLNSSSSVTMQVHLPPTPISAKRLPQLNEAMPA
jgi:hypothetical protein